MKSWLIVIILLLSLVLIGSLSCSPAESSAQEPHQQLLEQGDLTVTVSGSGNIEVANELKLTFSLVGKVDKIYVEEGDEVSEGEVLAELDTDALELALNEAQATLNQAQVTSNQAQIAVAQAQADVTQAQAGVTQAQVNLKNAEIALELARTTYSVSDIRAAEADVDVAQRNFDEALFVFSKYDPGTIGYERYQEVLLQSEAGLKAANDTLDAMLTGFDVKEVASKRLKVEATQQSLEAARQSFDLAKQSVELDQQSLEIANQSVALARQSVELAQKQFDEATLTAPFGGLVARVSVDEGDTISTITTIVHLIDPNSMELNIEVDEIDIPGVKLGQRAIIEVDALPDLPLEGKVSSISLLPTIETGLIMYDVKIEFNVPEGTVLRAGMSATADIVIAE